MKFMHFKVHASCEMIFSEEKHDFRHEYPAKMSHLAEFMISQTSKTVSLEL